MCIKPTMLDGVEVGCRVCWQCIKQKREALVADAHNEMSVTPFTVFVTLTYGRDEKNESDHIRTKLLHFTDFQKFMKRVRKIAETRYFVAGEYGSTYGRAHWHALLYMERDPTDPSGLGWEYGDRVHVEQWPHGHMSIRPALDHAAAYYISKYCTKEVLETNQQVKIGYSKKPPLGSVVLEKIYKNQAQLGTPFNPIYKVQLGERSLSVNLVYHRRAKYREVYDIAYYEQFGELPDDYEAPEIKNLYLTERGEEDWLNPDGKPDELIEFTRRELHSKSSGAREYIPRRMLQKKQSLVIFLTDTASRWKNYTKAGKTYRSATRGEMGKRSAK